MDFLELDSEIKKTKKKIEAKIKKAGGRDKVDTFVLNTLAKQIV